MFKKFKAFIHKFFSNGYSSVREDKSVEDVISHYRKAAEEAVSKNYVSSPSPNPQRGAEDKKSEGSTDPSVSKLDKKLEKVTLPRYAARRILPPKAKRQYIERAHVRDSKNSRVSTSSPGIDPMTAGVIGYGLAQDTSSPPFSHNSRSCTSDYDHSSHSSYGGSSSSGYDSSSYDSGSSSSSCD